MPKEQHDDLMTAVIALAQKLEKAKYHADRCSKLLKEATDAATGDSVTTTVLADLCSGVETEAEAFFFQSKAALDLASKVLRPCARINLATFGDKGERVIRALRRNVKAELRSKADALIHLIEDDQEWLGSMIDCRDTLTHFNGLESSGVVSQRVGDSVLVSGPAGKHGDIATQVQTLYFNLVTFCEDFVALAINVAMPPALTVQIVATSDRSDLLVSKYAIAMVPPIR